LDIQVEYLERALKFRERRGLSPEEDRALDMWEHCLKGLEADPTSLYRECDWVSKYRLVEQMRRRHDVSLSHPKVAMIDLMYHDVDRSRGLFYKLQQRDEMDRTCTDEAITEAMTKPPDSTRARLRGAFVKRAKERRRDFTVDWVHLKLNDQAQRTVLLKDPFKSHDERVERLIQSL
jgi:proteasome accessory factor A